MQKNIFPDFAQTAFETLNLWPLLKHSDVYIDCDAWPLIDRLRQQNKGIVALTAHLSNWDLLASYFCQRGLQITTIARPVRNKQLQSFISELRASYGINTIWRTNRAGLRLIVEQLEAGGILAALVDQDTRVGGCFVPFFGLPAYTPSSLVELGKRHQALFVSAFIVRTASLRYRIHVQEIDSNKTVEQILLEFNQQLQDLVKQYPSQWVWFHKRWQTTPNGRLSGSEYLANMASKLTLPR